MLIRQTSIGPQNTPEALCVKYFDAKMVDIADLDKSVNAFSRMRQVQDFFSVFYIPCEGNQKVCLSNQPLLGSQGDPKISPRHDFDAKKVIFYHCKFQNETFLALTHSIWALTWPFLVPICPFWVPIWSFLAPSWPSWTDL